MKIKLNNFQTPLLISIKAAISQQSPLIIINLSHIVLPSNINNPNLKYLK